MTVHDARTAAARLALLPALLALLLAACAIVVSEDEELADPAGEREPAPEVEADPAEGLDDPEGEDLEVELTVAEGPGGSTLAFVPVFIDDQGPFRFALDTGASDSVVHTAVAEEVGLELGPGQPVTGVTGTGEAARTEIANWRVDQVPLPAGTYGALDLPGAGTDAGFEGLLGSDVLSTFGAVTVDYERELLILRPGR